MHTPADVKRASGQAAALWVSYLLHQDATYAGEAAKQNLTYIPLDAAELGAVAALAASLGAPLPPAPGAVPVGLEARVLCESAA